MAASVTVRSTITLIAPTGLGRLQTMADKFEKGVVMAARGRMFDVWTEGHSKLVCELRKKVKRASEGATLVAVGDDILFSRIDSVTGVIEKVLERRTSFVRPAKSSETRLQVIAANLDQLAAIVSVISPPLKTGLIDRFLIAAERGSLQPVLVINKIDLGRPPELDGIADTYEKLGIAVDVVSAETGEGMPGLRAHLAEHRTLFMGHSGVGKSTLLNVLIPDLNLRTREVSSYSNRGKHTTSSLELYELSDGGFVADSPGLKVMGLWELDKDDLPHYYRDFRPFVTECRFQPCSHSHEPGCAVKSAVERGEISRFRHENYLAIAASLESGE
jgi:ribosome biogenesis GTPase